MSNHGSRLPGPSEMSGRPAPIQVVRDEVVPVRQFRRPVIIYTQSPKPIFVTAEGFQALVQSLTGRNPKRKADKEEKPQQLNKKQALDECVGRLEQEDFRRRNSSNKEPFQFARREEEGKIGDGSSLENAQDPSLRLGPIFKFGFGDGPIQYADSANSPVLFPLLTSPVERLTDEKFFSPNWKEGPACLSPRTYHVGKQQAKNAAAALRPLWNNPTISNGRQVQNSPPRMLHPTNEYWQLFLDEFGSDGLR